MTFRKQIENYIVSQPEQKHGEIRELHRVILEMMPECKLWFLDEKNREGKITTNPNIRFGIRPIAYSDGTIREFYQIGLSANKTVSLNILGLRDKMYLDQTSEKHHDKVVVTRYCNRFKTLKETNIEVRRTAIRSAIEEAML